MRQLITALMLSMVSCNLSAANNAYNEFNAGRYEDALVELQDPASPKLTKKDKKLLQQIRERGYEFYRTGMALLNFNPDLAKTYLSRAKVLIDPKDKQTMVKIENSLRSLEAVQ